MAKTPIAVLPFTIRDIEALDDKTRTSDEKLHYMGSLVFELRYRKATDENNPYFSLHLGCTSKSRSEGNSGEADMAKGWGHYAVDFGLEILKVKGESWKGGGECIFSKEKHQWGYPKLELWTTLLNPANKYVVNNELKVTAKIYSVSPFNVKSGEQLKLLKDPCSQTSLLETLLEDGIGSDVSFVIASDSEELKVKAHSGILIAASPVFKAMFEATMEETKKREIRMEDMTSAQSVRTFLKCIYTGSVSYLYGAPLRLLKEVINAAEKYQLEALKKRAAVLLPAHCCPGNALRLVHFAKRYGLEEVEKAIREYIKYNLDSIVDNTVPPDSD